MELVAGIVGALLGGLLTFASAAMVTRNARRVLETTLDAERTRLHQQIEAGREQLAVQLAHERSLRDHAELRELLDAAVSAMDDLAEAFPPIVLRAYDLLTKPTDADAEGLMQARDMFERRTQALSRFVPRIELRVGTDEPIALALSRVRTSWEAGVDELRRLPQLPKAEMGEAFERVKEAVPRSEAHARRFTGEAHRLVASRPFE